jgi:cytochrome c oxidase subunit IV
VFLSALRATPCEAGYSGQDAGGENMTEESKHIVRPRTFVLTWAGLLLLTALTVAAAKLHLGAASIVMPLLIASAKAFLVLWFFMHLKYERPLFRIMLLMPIVTLTFILALTFSDIWYR